MSERSIDEPEVGRRARTPMEDQEATPAPSPSMAGAVAERIGQAGLHRAVQRRLQRRAAEARAVDDPEQVSRAAEQGTSGGGGSLPHLDAIQRSFGQHDVTSIRAHTGPQASAAAGAMGAEAFATGDHVAFAGAPSLHTAAHEAAHVVQQRAGVHLKGGVGEEGDAYERHADAVADKVIAGQPADALLDAQVGAAPAVQRSPAAGSTAIQMNRAANPHERSGSHDGWDLTAHHVVAHNKLLEGLEALPEEQQLQLLTRAVPDTVTEAMLRQFTVEVDKLPEVLDRSKTKETAIADITRDLKDIGVANSKVIGSSTAGAIRQGFFEWMGGNQFIGPNTSIRPEPEDSKSAIDTDLKYMPNSDHADTLIGHGKSLYGALKLGKEESSRGADIFAALQKIIDTAKNIVPDSFNPESWVEVTSQARLEKLSRALGRAHMIDYTYFKFPAPKEGQDWPGFEKLKPTNSGLSEFSFGSVAKIPSKVGGGFVFVKVGDARGVVPVASEKKKLGEVCAPLIDATEATSSEVTVTFKSADAFKADGRTLTIGDWPDSIPCKKVEDKKVTFVANIYNSKFLTKTSNEPSLHAYLESKNAKLCTYIPKQLSDTVQD